jgi:hypothetical protein
MKQMCWLPTAAGLLLAVGCGSSWKEFSSPEGKFTVSMPGTPKKQTQNQGGLTTNAFAVEVKNGAYLVSYSDLPPGTPFDYSAGIRAMATKYQGKVLSETDFTLDGNKGKAYEMEINQPKGFATGRIVVVNNRLYQTLAIGTNARASDPDVKKFLDSFKLTK